MPSTKSQVRNILVGCAALAIIFCASAIAVATLFSSIEERLEYDIFFDRTIRGIVKGSKVTYLGVDAGKVSQIELWPQDPKFVRIRIAIPRGNPLMDGTQASIQSRIIGPAVIHLSEGRHGTTLRRPGPMGVPVIPAKAALNKSIVAAGPALIDRLSNLTENLNTLLEEDNRNVISKVISNTDGATRQIRNLSPEYRSSAKELRKNLQQATALLRGAEDKQYSHTQMGNSSQENIHEIRASLSLVERSIAHLRQNTQKVDMFFDRQATDPKSMLRPNRLSETSQGLRQTLHQMDERGIDSLFSKAPFPEYKQ